MININRCNECGSLFEEPRIYKTSYEAYYGVACDFSNSTPLELRLCPECGESDIEEINEEELEESEEQ